jgi:hypothetical protein
MACRVGLLDKLDSEAEDCGRLNAPGFASPKVTSQFRYELAPGAGHG